MTHHKPALFFVILVASSFVSAAAPPSAGGSSTGGIRWDAAKDLKRLNGRWQLTTRVSPRAFESSRLKDSREVMRSLYSNDSVLVVRNGRFAIPGTRLSGAASNGMNKIEFHPPRNRWTNTIEPRIVFAAGARATSADTFSYTVGPDRL